MKNKYARLFISLLIVLSFSVNAFGATVVALNKMLAKLNRSNVTSLQRSDLIQEYKGQVLKGKGKIQDVLKSAASENQAMVYLEKYFKNKKYDIVLSMDIVTAEKLKKGKVLNFSGEFDGITGTTLRFKNIVIPKKKWFFF